MRPLEATGNRGALVRLEARLQDGKLEQKKLHTYDVAKAILEAVPPGPHHKFEETGYSLTRGGCWVNDPVDLVQSQATKKLKLEDFPYKIEYLPHTNGQDRLKRKKTGLHSQTE
jgi:hypothetical protein